MTSHEAVKRMAKAWKHVRRATELVTCPIALDNLNEAESHIYEVGEQKFGEDFKDEVKRQYSDA